MYKMGTEPRGAGGAGGAGGGSGKGDELLNMYESLLATTEQGIQAALATPEGRRSFGSLGSAGRFASAATNIIDNLTGANTQDVVKAFFGGQDPVMMNNYLKYSILPVARMMVDKGVLAGAEQARAKALLAVAGGNDASGEQELLGPDQAAELATITIQAAKRAVAQAKGQPINYGSGASTPPAGMQSPPQAGSAEGAEENRPPPPPGDGWTWHPESRTYRRLKQ
jgi:hypothetical protein